eukprot:c10505_g1_i1 orf=2-226(-)
MLMRYLSNINLPQNGGGLLVRDGCLPLCLGPCTTSRRNWWLLFYEVKNVAEHSKSRGNVYNSLAKKSSFVAGMDK